MAISGSWYNIAYSGGCALGAMVAGALSAKYTFAGTVSFLALLNVPAIGLLFLDAYWTQRCARRCHLGRGPFRLRFTYVAPVLVTKY
eukprot:COSAG01_NODE_8891_length_2625_cov_1.409343_6_plen_87_part_00